MKKYKKIILSIIVVLAAILSFGYSVHKNTKVNVTTIEQFNSIDNGFIYFGRDDCSSCSLFSPPLYKVAKQHLVKINYVDTNLFREKKHLEDILSKYDVQSVPTLIEVKNGKLEAYFQAEIFNEEPTDKVITDINQFISTSPAKIKLSQHQITNIVIHFMTLVLLLISIYSKPSSSKILIISLGLVLLISNYFNIGIGVGIENYNEDYFTYIEYVDALGLYNMIIVAISFIIFFIKRGIIKYEIIKKN